MNTVVIRMSSLGDIVLSASITHALAPVTYITKPQYREVVQSFQGVDVVCCPPEDPLPAEAKRIIDLHNNLASFAISRKIKGQRLRVQRHDWTRRSRVWFKGLPPPSVISRYERVAKVKASPLPWITRSNTGDALLICPSSIHPTKVWSHKNIAAVAKMWNGPVIVLGSQKEQLKIRTLVDEIGSKAEAICEKGFKRTIQSMNRAAAAIGMDSGLTHLCAAYGIPTLVVMGPTHENDGFWPHANATISLPLYCRPCSRFGGEICPIGDHYCMVELSPEQVWNSLQSILA